MDNNTRSRERTTSLIKSSASVNNAVKTGLHHNREALVCVCACVCVCVCGHDQTTYPSIHHVDRTNKVEMLLKKRGHVYLYPARVRLYRED